jgi:hypothetical protein
VAVAITTQRAYRAGPAFGSARLRRSGMETRGPEWMQILAPNALAFSARANVLLCARRER